VTAGEDHRAKRPEWICDCCGEPWPCEPARDYLLADTGGGTALALVCWAYFEDYVNDMGPRPLGEAYRRFLGWARGAK
jgi:hypothetical protein